MQRCSQEKDDYISDRCTQNELISRLVAWLKPVKESHDKVQQDMNLLEIEKGNKQKKA